MKKYRVVYKTPDRADAVARTEVVEADTWRVDYDLVCLYRREGGEEVRVFDVPKTNVMRILELR